MYWLTQLMELLMLVLKQELQEHLKIIGLGHVGILEVLVLAHQKQFYKLGQVIER